MATISRRTLLTASGASLLLPRAALAVPLPGRPFAWDDVIARARALARTPYAETPRHPAAAAIDYEALNRIRFREERTIWDDHRDASGLRLFPLHRAAAQPVAINLIEQGQARPLGWDPDYFAMPADSPARQLGAQGGFSGFRFMTPARDADWLVFMGASYFRAAGNQKQYGLSARAVAIDTAKGPEEFPRFTEFWIGREPDGGVTVHALLDGPSLTGAWRFANRLDADGVHQQVDAVIFPRRAIAELGLMPMTSMFWYDQTRNAMTGTNRGQNGDWRPEVHDSDGLLIRSADGGAHFRPLVNPPAPRTDGFAETSPTGFGLLQRDRNFDHYQDDGVFYDRRPSLFATPASPLGPGQVRLYTFPTGSEYDDNVTAYWTPAAPVVAGRMLRFGYRLDWQADAPAPLARLADIWRGLAGPDQATGARPAIRLVADFSGIDRPLGQAQIWTEVKGGTLLKSAAYPLVGRSARWRAIFDIAPDGDGPVDIRAQLRAGTVPLSEFLHYPLYH